MEECFEKKTPSKKKEKKPQPAPQRKKKNRGRRTWAIICLFVHYFICLTVFLFSFLLNLEQEGELSNWTSKGSRKTRENIMCQYQYRLMIEMPLPSVSQLQELQQYGQSRFGL